MRVAVNPKTLKHINNDNIWALGDCNDAPVQPSFFAGIYQSHVVRHNILNRLKGVEENAEYKGNSKVNLFRGVNRFSWYSEVYGKPGTIYFKALFTQYIGFYLFFDRWVKSQLIKIYKEGAAGPPKFRFGY